MSAAAPPEKEEEMSEKCEHGEEREGVWQSYLLVNQTRGVPVCIKCGLRFVPEGSERAKALEEAADEVERVHGWVDTRKTIMALAKK
jgi:hypothetical protein